MSHSRWLVVALISSIVVMPSISTAQTADSTKGQLKDNPQDFAHDVLRAILGPNWNLFAHIGLATDDRFELQQVVTPTAGLRSLESATGFAIGAGGGVDILLHTGLRASYTFASRNMNFRTDNGDGSNALNVNDVGTLKSSTIALEVIHYMLPELATINPYGTLGIQGTWWALREKSPLVTSSGAGTPFSISPLFSFGFQYKPSRHFGARLEATLSSGHNPFTGNKAFRVLDGTTVDQSTSIAHTDFRLAGVYYFGKPKLPSTPPTVTHE